MAISAQHIVAFTRQRACWDTVRGGLARLLPALLALWARLPAILQFVSVRAITNSSSAGENIDPGSGDGEGRVVCEMLHSPPPDLWEFDVIFIHGLHGSTVKTWRQGDWHSKYREVQKIPLRKANHCSSSCQFHVSVPSPRATDVPNSNSPDNDPISSGESDGYNSDEDILFFTAERTKEYSLGVEFDCCIENTPLSQSGNHCTRDNAEICAVPTLSDSETTPTCADSDSDKAARFDFLNLEQVPKVSPAALQGNISHCMKRRYSHETPSEDVDYASETDIKLRKMNDDITLEEGMDTKDDFKYFEEFKFDEYTIDEDEADKSDILDLLKQFHYLNEETKASKDGAEVLDSKEVLDRDEEGLLDGSVHSCEDNGDGVEKSSNVEELLSSCWPRDWIPLDYPGARVMSLTYTTDQHLWRPIWIKPYSRSSLRQRSEDMIRQLDALGAGSKPIIWVGHSKGGLFIKEMFADGYETWSRGDLDSACARIYLSSRALVFYSVPHRGSPLANITLPPLLRVSSELEEIQHESDFVLNLHDRFLRAVNEGHVRPVIQSYSETRRTLMGAFYLRIVSLQSADPGIGSMYGVSLDHREICKPTSRECFLYRELLSVINDILNSCKDL